MIVHPCTNLCQTRPAAEIIEAMVALLRKRRSLKIKRVVFLVAWGKLRRELERTREYQAFRTEVLRRDGNRCGTCGRVAHTVHHPRRVAKYPRLALDPRNGRVRCTECHEAVHPHLKRRSA